MITLPVERKNLCGVYVGLGVHLCRIGIYGFVQGVRTGAAGMQDGTEKMGKTCSGTDSHLKGRGKGRDS